MIVEAEFEEYRAFSHLRVTFEPLTVFVGPNACGKTSLLRGIEDGLDPRRAAIPDAVRRGALQDSVIRLRLDDVLGLLVRQPDIASQGASEDLTTILAKNRVRRLRLQTALIASETGPTDAPTVADDGSGSSTWYVHAKGESPDLIDQLEKDLRRLVPSFRRIRYRVTRNGHQLLFDMSTSLGVEAYLVSEGTLLSLGLLSVIYSDPNVALLLIDDLDRGMHPLAQQELVGVLRGVQAQRPGLQIIATSHSPYLLDRLRPEEIRLMSLSDSGSPVCKRLIDHPHFERWKDEMTPGEMWTMFGEKWVAEQPHVEAGA